MRTNLNAASVQEKKRITGAIHLCLFVLMSILPWVLSGCGGGASHMAATGEAAKLGCKAVCMAEEIYVRDHTGPDYLQKQYATSLKTLHDAQQLLEADFANADADGSKPVAHAGYFYRILKGQGKNADGGEKSYVNTDGTLGRYAVLAYPAEYGKSGTITIMLDSRGSIYVKDLGKDSDKIAPAITLFDPDSTWRTE